MMNERVDVQRMEIILRLAKQRNAKKGEQIIL